MLINILRSLRGYVGFDIRGKYPERFINITSRNGIRIWGVSRSGDGFSAYMYMSDYRRIRPLARRAGVRLRITAKSGMPSYIIKYRGRVGVALGACAFIITVFVMSMFIWSVDITGLETVSISEMRELLREQGLYVGAFKPSLDFQGVAREIMINKKEIGWMAVNAAGSYASVEVKEETPAPEVTDIDSPCNVKAERDGRILSLDTEQGVAVITEGSGVIAGQMIVSGVTSDALGGVRLVHSKAQVMAQTERRADFSTDKSFTVLKPDGETAVRKRLKVIGAALPYAFESVSSPYSLRDSYSECPSPLGVDLPVERETELVYSLEPVEHHLDNNSAEELLTTQSRLYETFVFSDCSVTSRDYDLISSDGSYKLSVIYTCIEDIAYTSPIITDENTVLLDRDPEAEKEE